MGNHLVVARRWPCSGQLWHALLARTSTMASQAQFRKAAEKMTIGAGSSSGRIALRNAVEKSKISRSIAETAPRVLSLHRDMLRSVPWVKRAYAVIMPEEA